MMTVIHSSAFSSFYYWKKPVTGRLGRSHQNQHFIAVLGTQDWFSLSPQSYEIGLQAENSKLNTDLHTTEITQIPIVLRYSEIPCLRPAVSSLGACPTPAL